MTQALSRRDYGTQMVFMYESSGSGNSPDYQSTLRQVDLATGKILQEYTLPIEYFGEGIAVVDDKIIQLTWQST